MIGIEYRQPRAATIGIRGIVFENIARPRRTESFSAENLRAPAAVQPHQPRLLQFQRLIQSRSRQLGATYIDLPVPTAAGRRRPFAAEVGVRRTGQIPATIQRVAES